MLATYHWNYDDKGEGPFAERIYEALRLLNLPKWDGKNEADKAKSRPNFMTLYLDEPDHTGHSHGPYDSTGQDFEQKKIFFPNHINESRKRQF